MSSALNVRSAYNEGDAKHPQFIAFMNRYRTFNNWPNRYELQTARNMALAGFYYLGSLDRARCFYCGLTLRDWDEDDDPFKSHRQWSPLCAYISTIADQQLSSGLQSLHIAGTGSSTVPGGQSTERYTFSNYRPTSGITTDSLTCSDSRSSPVRAQSSNNGFSTMMFTSQERPVVAGATTVDGPTEDLRQPTYVEAVLEMGYSLDVIQQTIDRRRGAGMGEFSDASSLMAAIEGWD